MSHFMYGERYHLTDHTVMDASEFQCSAYSETDFRTHSGPAGIKPSTTGHLLGHKQINPLSLH